MTFVDITLVKEELVSDQVPLYSHPLWREQWPWLLQGTTGRGHDNFDLSFFGQTPTGTVMTRWRQVREFTGFPAIVHAQQVHGANVLYHKHGHPGVNIGDSADGHATLSAGALLAVSIADCVPISLVDPEKKAIALLHAGWRGVAAGILERGTQLLMEKGSAPGDLHCHFGPAICGNCYEVRAEVFAGVGVPAPGAKGCINLRENLAERATRLGIPAPQISISEWCTRCGGGAFFSHRGGDRERQMALLGIWPQ